MFLASFGDQHLLGFALLDSPTLGLPIGYIKYWPAAEPDIGHTVTCGRQLIQTGSNTQGGLAGEVTVGWSPLPHNRQTSQYVSVNL